MSLAEVHSLRLLPQRPIIEYAEPAIVVRELSYRYEPATQRVRRYADPMLNALLKYTLPPTRMPFMTITWALRDLSLAIYPGEVVAVTGPRGSGKSTLLKLIARKIAPTIGDVQTCGVVRLMAVSAADTEIAGVDVLLIEAGTLLDETLPPLRATVARARQRNAAVLIATRDADSISRLCTRVLCLNQGALASDEDTTENAPQ